MTITTTTKKPNWLLAIGLPCIIYCLCFTIANTVMRGNNADNISNAILIDILVTAPLIYWLVIRKTSVKAITVIRVFVVGILIAGFILRSVNNTYLHLIKQWLSPVIELVVVVMLVRKIRVANKAAKANKTGTADFLVQCRKMFQSIVGSDVLGAVIASEISVLYYAFGWRKQVKIDNQILFSNYKKNGLQVLLSALLMVLLIEALAMHFVLAKWHVITAWVITGASLYTCLQLLAHMRAIVARPIVVTSGTILVHNGLAGDANIPLHLIDKIEFSKALPKDKKIEKMALLKGVEQHNIVVHLKAQITVSKVFGVQRKTDTVAFFVDEPKQFVERVALEMVKFV